MLDKVYKVRDLAQEERFDEALVAIAEIEKTTALTPNLLVLKGICLELAEKQPADAEHAFRAALDIDDEYIEALNELGSFYLTVGEDSAKAMPLFEKAVDICEAQMTEAVVGMAVCLMNTAGKDKALQYLKDVRKSALDLERIEEIEKEINLHR